MSVIFKDNIILSILFSLLAIASAVIYIILIDKNKKKIKKDTDQKQDEKDETLYLAIDDVLKYADLFNANKTRAENIKLFLNDNTFSMLDNNILETEKIPNNNYPKWDIFSN